MLADAAQLEAALLNIAINARDAMADGGTLEFRIGHVARLPPGAIGDTRASMDRPDLGYVAILISDTGTGMDDDVRERAFEPFFTTKDVGKGTGLGLSTAYGFIRQSRGAVTLDSAPGAGTRVGLYLPAAPAGDAVATDENDEPVALAGLRVLLVEDEADVRDVAVRFLRQLHCDVETADSAESALAMLSTRDDIGLLLTDIALGAGMRGDELALQARRRYPDLPVLLVSGDPSALLDADANLPSDWELLQKPYSRDELARAIGRVASAS